MTCGIYHIEFPTSIYVGQSVDVERRLKAHRTKLRAGKHENKNLQDVYNKFQGTCVSFELIEECDPFLLNRREEYWINYYNIFNSLNKRWHVYSNVDRSLTEQGRLSISLKHKGGRSHSPEQNRARSETMGTKVVLSDGQTFRSQRAFAAACGYKKGPSVRNLLVVGYTYNDIARKNGILK